MKISILVSDISNNNVGRTWLLAKILQRRYNVEIIGPMFGPSIWEPVRSELAFTSVKGTHFPRLVPEILKMLKLIDGDVIYANKPLLASFTTGLIKKKLGVRPVILDIDDWELPLFLKYNSKNPLNPNSYWAALLNERLIRYADDITVSSRFLQRRFGGALIPHVRDTDSLDPDKYDPYGVKQQLGLTGRKVIGFLGTPRPHKGIEDLVSAMRMIGGRETALMVVGMSDDLYCRNLLRRIRRVLPADRFFGFGLTPLGELPKFLSAADVVVVPQRKSMETIGQVPAKVFDAMAMAKPIVSTRVSDLPEILDGCGWLVDPGHPEQLAGAITEVLSDLDSACEKGILARERCKRLYSYDAVEPILTGIFDKYR